MKIEPRQIRDIKSDQVRNVSLIITKVATFGIFASNIIISAMLFTISHSMPMIICSTLLLIFQNVQFAYKAHAHATYIRPNLNNDPSGQDVSLNSYLSHKNTKLLLLCSTISTISCYIGYMMLVTQLITSFMVIPVIVIAISFLMTFSLDYTTTAKKTTVLDSSNQVIENSILRINHLKSFKTLRTVKLNLSNIVRTDETIKRLADKLVNLKYTPILELNLNFNNQEIENIISIIDYLKTFKTLRTLKLNLSNIVCTDETLKRLADKLVDLEHIITLELNLNFNNVAANFSNDKATEAGVKVFADRLVTKDLCKLNIKLEITEFNDPKLQLLSSRVRELQNSDISYSSLYNTRITNVWFKELLAALNNLYVHLKGVGVIRFEYPQVIDSQVCPITRLYNIMQQYFEGLPERDQWIIDFSKNIDMSSGNIDVKAGGAAQDMFLRQIGFDERQIVDMNNKESLKELAVNSLQGNQFNDLQKQCFHLARSRLWYMMKVFSFVIYDLGCSEMYDVIKLLQKLNNALDLRTRFRQLAFNDAIIALGQIEQEQLGQIEQEQVRKLFLSDQYCW